jgi:stage V sporulation protein G
MTFETRIKKFFHETDKNKATVSITIDGSYAVHGIKILEAASGLAVVMPNRKFSHRYYDTFHPVNAEARAKLVNVIMTAYHEAVKQTDEASMAESKEPKSGK